jgi:hypothetical protein
MQTNCPYCNKDITVIVATGPLSDTMNPRSSGPGFPLLKYDHLFASQAELDDYERRVRERDENLDAQQQGELQPGQKDVRDMDLEPDLQFVLAELGRNGNSVNAFRVYGPTRWMHQLSQLAHASGIHDRGDGFVTAPLLFPQLEGKLTVQRAKELAGLA